MKKFNIKVNGKSYEIEVEEIKERPAVTPARPVKSAKPPLLKPSPPSRPVAPKPIPAQAGELIVYSPMPGTVVGIEVKEGEMVKQGQVLLILEAMKMENEIPAPADGRVVSIKVAKGASIKSGDILIMLQ
jgi:biotin carboxyl carrier protein